MQIQTLLLIILAALIAAGIVVFQYFFKERRKNKLYILLGFLRFLALFGIFLLLINPKITRNTYSLDHTNFVLLVDNSSSISNANAGELVQNIVQTFSEDQELNSHFKVSTLSFGAHLNSSDSVAFDEKLTNISGSLESLSDVYGNGNAVVALITDGNQTIGRDYQFLNSKINFPIYPIVIGDTTSYEDLRIDQVNTNRYAFLRNKFPIEVFTTYRGQGAVAKDLVISVNGKIVFRKQLQFNANQNSITTSTNIEAETVGIKKVEVSINPIANERNTNNNNRIQTIEVIDEKTRIGLVSAIMHPDLGMLKKAIESNEQRSVILKKPTDPVATFEELDLFILYQPTSAFSNVYDLIKKRGANTFTITGAQTDWNFLNKAQTSFEKNSHDQEEEILPILNAGFTKFDISNLSTEGFPPLEGYLGEILITKVHEIVLGQRVKGVDLNEPLLAILGSEDAREAVLFGENIWKWRAQSFRNNQAFESFDEFIGKIILYISSNRSRNRLTIDYQNSYLGVNDGIIRASYFNEAYEFDGNASIVLNIKGINSETRIELPMLLKQGYYEADMGNLPAGDYNFSVQVKDQNLTKSGQFTMLDFDVEKQLLSSDFRKLTSLAQSTNGQLYFPDQLTQMTTDLLANNQLAPTQKSKQNVVSLIDYKILLGIIAMAFAAEWFIRKYNGLI